MTNHSPERSFPRRSAPGRPRFQTAVSALALALGLTACASGTASPPTSTAAQTDVKGAMLLKIADETSANGDPATAASLYRQLHDAQPKDPVPLARLAATFMSMQDYRSAAQAYRAAIALQPENADFHRGLALADLVLGDPQGAMAEVRSALAQHADDARLYSVLGVAQDMTGQHDLAQQSYQHGLEMAPANIGLRNNYAMSLALAGDYGSAVGKLAEIAGPAAAPRYRLNLALAYGLAGDDTKAAATARQVLDEPSVQNNLAFYALLRGMTEQQRNAAIIGSELHGVGVPPVDMAARKEPQPQAIAAAPQAPVAQAALDPVTVIDQPPPRVAALAPETLVKTTLPTAPAAAAPVASAAPTPLAPAAAVPVASVPPASRVAALTQDKLAKPVLRTAPAKAASAVDSPVASAPPPAPAADMPVASMPPAPAAQPESSPAPDAVTASSNRPAPAAAPTELTPMPVDLKPQSWLAPAPMPDAAPAIADLNSVVLDLATAEPVVATAADLAPLQAMAAEPAPLAAPAITPAITPVSAPAAAAATVGAPMAAALVMAPSHAAPATSERYTVQLGSYLLEASARHDADFFAAKGAMVSVSRATDHDGREWFVLRTAEFAHQDQADSVLKMLQSMGAVGPMLLHRQAANRTA